MYKYLCYTGSTALTTSQALTDPTMASSNRAPLHGWRRLSKVAAALQSASPHPTLPTLQPITTTPAAADGRPEQGGPEGGPDGAGRP